MEKKVFFVSLGPGDPELITLKGIKKLQEASYIFCPATETKSGKLMSRSMNIIKALDINMSKVIPFSVPMNQDHTIAEQAYKVVAEKIIKYHQSEDGDIVICAQGDASFYSSIHYFTNLLLASSISTGRIAGVPAFIAAGTLADIHIVKQSEKLCVLPGRVDWEELEEKVMNNYTVVIMKTPMSEEIIKKAINSMPSIDFHYFENIGVSGKEFYTQEKQVILERSFPYFSLIIVKKREDSFLKNQIPCC